MYKKLLFLIMIVAASVFLSGCTDDVSDEASTEISINAELDSECDNQCNADSGDTFIYCYNGCMNQKALVEDDYLYCVDMLGGDQINNAIAQGGCVSRYARQDRNVDLCEELTDLSRDVCISGYVGTFGETQYCDRIVDDTYRAACEG